MSENRLTSLIALAVAAFPITLSAQEAASVVPADYAESGVAASVPMVPQMPVMPTPETTRGVAVPPENDFRPAAQPEFAFGPGDEGTYGAPSDPGHGWARDSDYAYRDYGYGDYGKESSFWADPGYGSGYGGSYGYPQDNMYRQPVPQGGYYQEMRRPYGDPYASSGYAAAEPMPRAPQPDYHREMIQRLDAIVDRLERIEKALLNKGG